MPATTLLFRLHFHLRQYSSDGTIRKSLPMHIENGVDDMLLPFVLDDFPAYATFSKWQTVNPVWRGAVAIEWYSKSN